MTRENLLDEYNKLSEELAEVIGKEPMKTVNRLVEIEHELTKTEEA